MNDKRQLKLRVKEAIGHDIEVFLDHGDVVLRGEVPRLADKKLALERAAAVPGVSTIVDRLHVSPTVRREDAEIARDVGRALVAEPLLGECSVDPGAIDLPRAIVLFPEGTTGLIEISVEDGVVTLDGNVSELAKKQLAGVLTWRVPGCRDVVNGLEVTEPPSSDEWPLASAVRLALEQDPALDVSAIVIRADGRTVTLEGHAASEAEARLAENDAWTVFGVDNVDNRLVVEKR
jgi:osmotically-inducible protein OsmY